MAIASKPHPFGARRTVLALAITCCCGGNVIADRLQPATATLTTYQAAPTHKQGVRPRGEQRVVNYDGSKFGGGGGIGGGGGGGDDVIPVPLPPPRPPIGGGCDIVGDELVEFGPLRGTAGGQVFNGINLKNGVFMDQRAHLHLPQPGGDWVISSDHNPRQDSDSAGPQGLNRFQGSMREVRDYGDPAIEGIYLVVGANGYQEFELQAGADLFQAANGGTAIAQLVVAANSPDLVHIYDSHGTEWVYFGFDNAGTESGVVVGQLWKIIDPHGNVSFVGDASSAATAKSSGYDAITGMITKAYDAADRRYTYTYGTVGGQSTVVLTKVEAETKTGGTWASPTGLSTVGKVEYSHYVNADTHGSDVDLKMVKTTIPLTDSGAELVTKTYYRYYEGTYNATTNPGHPGQIKYIYESEGLRQYDWIDSTFDEDFLGASNDDLKAYASAFFKYDSEKRVIEAWFNGACGCAGGSGTGTYTFSYVDNSAFSPAPGGGYDTEWHTLTIMQEPDKGDEASATSKYVTTYFDELGQVMAQLVTEATPASEPSPTRFWATVYDRDWSADALDGIVEQIHTPANISAYDYLSSGTVIYSFTLENSIGLVHAYDRYTTGNFQGLTNHVKYKKGNTGAANLQESLFYDRTTKTVTSGGNNVTVARSVIAAQTVYTIQTATADAGPGNSPPSGAYRTEYTYDFYDDSGENAPLATHEITTTFPIVTTGNNGSNSATTFKQHFLKTGRVDFTKSELGIIRYHEYNSHGLLSKVIEDADTTQDGGGGEQTDFSGITIPTGYDTDSPSAAFHVRRTMTYDRVGRLEKSVTYKAKSATIEDESLSYTSKLADLRVVTLNYPKFETSGTKYYGPVGLTVTNHSGGATVNAAIALADNSGEFTTDAQSTHVDEADSDPIFAVEGIGLLRRMTVQVFNKAGTRIDESRAYFLTPDPPTGGAGSDGANYDATTFAHDNLGRRWRTEDPTGTVRRTVFDAIGRGEEQWIGTNDNDTETALTPEKFPGGDTTGTSDMVRIEALVYDATLAAGNSNLTKRTAFVQDNTTDQRETNFAYDLRGRMLLQTNSTAPHIFNKYDDAGRMIASGMFSSTANIDLNPTPPTLPDDPTTETSNRLALSQTFYDEKGQVWKSQRHKIDDADGSDDDNLQELTWYDAAGKVIKVDGGQLTKTFYDRLDRATHQFDLASISDSAYADADDVSGDIVLQESQTTYDRDSGLALMSAVIERFHDDFSTGETTGALDTNADADSLLYTAANIEGRIQITSQWYDSLDRVQDIVAYGTNGGSNFDRDGLPVPARSDTALRTTYVYNADGTTFSVTDPKAIVTRLGYDHAGRQTLVINNYLDGTPSGVTGADDVHTRHSFTDGLKTKLHMDFDGAGDEDAGDQVTTWTYGVTKGASAGDSKIGAGHLLKKVIYPAQSGGQSEADRRVSYAYNAQRQTIWTEDQTTTVIQSDYDVSGRQTHRRVTTVGSGIDNAVLRISATYDSLGRRSLVTQYSNATVGSGSVTDEVKFTYDDWGNVEKFEQDRDSAVSGGGNDYEVSYTYAKATDGRNTVRRTSMTLPSGNVIDYTYSSTSDLHDADASRVTEVKDGATSMARYWYNGVGSVVGILNDEPDIFMRRYSTTSGQYPDLDNFNRVIGDTWHKDLATDRAFFDTDIFYDRNSNINRTEDNVYIAAKDIAYTTDNLNRLTDAQWGTWGGSSIGSEVRQRTWILDQVGNWSTDSIDTTNDGDYNDATDTTDTRTHNLPNELLARVMTEGTTELPQVDLTYNKRGDMTDDGEHYEYVYDAFGRLRKINRTDNQNLVTEYHYNPLGFRRSWKYDNDSDGDVDANDKTYHFASDERWRIAATFRDSDSAPKEEFIYHAAGADGYGSSSYIDAVVARDRDNVKSWTAAAGSLTNRWYLAQNWRADVVAVVTGAGVQVEQARYGEYGVPIGMPAGDTDGDGDVNNGDTSDTDQIQTWINVAAYDVRGDMDLDGDVDAADKTAALANANKVLGWGKLSLLGALGGNRKGYAGYEFEPSTANSLWLVRQRVLNSNLGRWTSRDPLQYVDGPNMYQYCISAPLTWTDADGTDCPGCDTGHISPCHLRCCAQHDRCYDVHNCNALTLHNLCRSLSCTFCDLQVATCFARCLVDDDWNDDWPLCYCHREGYYYNPDEDANWYFEEDPCNDIGTYWWCCCVEPNCETE